MVASQSLEKCEVAKNLIIHICLMVVMVILIGCDALKTLKSKVTDSINHLISDKVVY